MGGGREGEEGEKKKEKASEEAGAHPSSPLSSTSLAPHLAFIK